MNSADAEALLGVAFDGGEISIRRHRADANDVQVKVITAEIGQDEEAEGVAQMRHGVRSVVPLSAKIPLITTSLI